MEREDFSTFESIFFSEEDEVPVVVPDYQRAYAWEQKQIDLFIGDLVKYHTNGNGYYFGHFIMEDGKEGREIVDGQQRITTFALFLLVCRMLTPSGNHEKAFALINRFRTVSYDDHLFNALAKKAHEIEPSIPGFDGRRKLSDEEIQGIMATLSLNSECLTRSQRRMLSALCQFHNAFNTGKKLDREKIGDYIDVVMKSHCSCHLTRDKSVAVNIFEMQNTRGVALTTLEIVKAKLMQFVYDNGDEDRERNVEQIQKDFGEIYGLEERLAAKSFRGEMTMDQLLRLHLRVVDDGSKNTDPAMRTPPMNATAEKLIEYIDRQLSFMDGDESQRKPPEEGVNYALNLARELKVSVRIVSETLPEWDRDDALVGDVMILERDWSCQFFLIVCRQLENVKGKVDDRVGKDTLTKWEKLLFTRDFHGKYYNLKGGRDNFPELFRKLKAETSEDRIAGHITFYLANGFRYRDYTKNLQKIVREHVTNDQNKERILKRGFYWWKEKMIYAIYKYEISKGANLRAVMKGSNSVEHILPQNWDWKWIEQASSCRELLSEADKKEWSEDIASFINGIGNLLLLTPGENTSQGYKHPAEKRYTTYCAGGSYKKHDENREAWRNPDEWSRLIEERGKDIYNFMLDNLVGKVNDSDNDI